MIVILSFVIRSVIPVERATAIPRCLNELNGDYLTEVPGIMNVSRTIAFGKCLTVLYNL